MSHKVLHILGGGAIGQLFASKINLFSSSHGTTAKLLLRKSSKHLRRVKRNMVGGNDTNKLYINIGIAEVYKGSYTATTNSSCESLYSSVPIEFIEAEQYDSESNCQIDHLILCTKAYDAKVAVESVLNRFHPATKITILSNGALSIRDDLTALLLDNPIAFYNEPISLASTYHGVYQKERSSSLEDEDYKIIHAGMGQTFVTDEHLAKVFDMSGLNCALLHEQIKMEVLLWEKLAANCVLNPLTALLNCKNGDILVKQQLNHLHSSEPFHDNSNNNNDNNAIIKDVISEVEHVAIAYFRDRQYDDLQLVEYTDREEKGEQFVNNHSPLSFRPFIDNVIDATSSNISSMLQDVRANRKTEIDALNGYITSLGIKYKIGTPTNARLVDAIKNVENNYCFNTSK